MSTQVFIIGDGVLTDIVCNELKRECVCEFRRHSAIDTVIPKDVELAVVLSDAWHPSLHMQAEQVFVQNEIPWFGGFVAFGRGIIGPLVRPGVPGCSQCADLRRLMAEPERQEMWQFRLQLAVQGGVERDAWASRSSLRHLAHLIVAQIEGQLHGDDPLQLTGHIVYAHLKTLDTSRHAFLPDPQCPICGDLPDDSPEAASISLQPSPKVHEGSYRTQAMDDLKRVLAKDYLDVRTGLMNARVQDLITPYAAVSVNLPLMMGDEGTAGRTHVYPESELTAILEGLERYCGLEPRGKKTQVHDCFANLKDKALNPATVGLHAPDQYALQNFPFQPYDEHVEVDWVWGYSLTENRPILVPQLLAYYSLGCRAGFVYETSNGCAVGGSLVETIFHGILEVVERDAFLMTWYAQLPLPRVDVDSIEDMELQLMLRRLRAAAGYDVLLYNATMENGIPSVFAIAKNTRTQGVNLICAAGSHIDPVRAVKGAIHELAGMLLRFDEKLDANREDYLRMYHDASFVRQMEDHSMLYALPEAEERLRFLLDDNRCIQSFSQAFQWNSTHTDLTDDLQDLLAVFRRLNLQVIVVNQTAPELQRNHLFCVKVLIPGMLPMTFGNHLTRLEGLHRVLRVPMELGFVDAPLTREQLNPYPHPFP